MMTSATTRNTTDSAAELQIAPFQTHKVVPSGRKQSLWTPFALPSFILHNVGSASRFNIIEEFFCHSHASCESHVIMVESRRANHAQTNESCFKNPGLYTALKLAVMFLISWIMCTKVVCGQVTIIIDSPA